MIRNEDGTLSQAPPFPDWFNEQCRYLKSMYCFCVVVYSMQGRSFSRDYSRRGCSFRLMPIRQREGS